jgi:hypothetical protein
MRMVTKIMMTRIIFDDLLPRTSDLYKVIRTILNLNAEKVKLNPMDSRCVIRALKFEMNNKMVDDNYLKRLDELYNDHLIRSKL